MDVKDKFTIFALVEMALATITSVNLAPFNLAFGYSMDNDKRHFTPIFYAAAFLPVLYRFVIVLIDKTKFEKVVEYYWCIICAVIYLLGGIFEFTDDDRDHDQTHILLVRSICSIACGVMLLVDLILGQCGK